MNHSGTFNNMDESEKLYSELDIRLKFWKEK